MDDDDFEAFEIAEITEYRMSRRFHKADLIVLGLDLIRGLSAAITSTLTTAQELAGLHANFKCDQEDFHEQAALEIEMLTNGEDE